MTDEELEQTVLPPEPAAGDDDHIIPPTETPAGDHVLDIPPTEIPDAPAPAVKSHKGLRIAAIAAAVVVVLGIIAAFAAPAILKALNPKAGVAAALGETFNRAGFGDAAGILTDLGKTASELELSLHLGDQIPPSMGLGDSFGVADEQLSGTGFAFSMQMDEANRKMSANLGFDLGTLRAFDLRFFADDAALSFGSPELTGDKFYSVNTETLGADWAGSEFWSAVEGVDPTISFNLFDPPEVVPEDNAALAEASLKLNKAATVTKEGNTYLLTVPADAMQVFLREIGANSDINDSLSEYDLTAEDLARAFTDDLSGTFVVEKGAVTSMELSLPFTADGEALTIRFLMTLAEDGALSFLLEGIDAAGSVGISMSATLSVYADKKSQQVGFDLPEILMMANDETLSFSAGLTMEPMGEFSFQPQDPTPIFELDENGVLELLFGALGGLQSISGGITG